MYSNELDEAKRERQQEIFEYLRDNLTIREESELRDYEGDARVINICLDLKDPNGETHQVDRISFSL